MMLHVLDIQMEISFLSSGFMERDKENEEPKHTADF